MPRDRSCRRIVSRRTVQALTGILAAWTASPALAAARGDVPTYDARTFFETTTIFGASFSHDESRLLMTSDASGIFNVYAQPITGGAPVQLTSSEDNATFAIGYFPENDRFLYQADQAGNELFHIYVRGLDGTDRDLTPGDRTRAQFAGWLDDDSGFHVLTNERDPRYMDLYRYDATTYERTLIYRNEAGFDVAGVSRDGRRVALIKVRNNADDDIYIFDAKKPDESPALVTAHEGDVAHGYAGFSPDHGALYYTSNRDSEFSRVWKYDFEAAAHSLLAEAEWDIVAFDDSRTGRYRIVAVNADARTEITVLDTTTGTPQDLPDLPRGDITGVTIARSEKLMAFYVNGDTSPSNLYILPLGRPATKAHRLTGTLNPKIDEDHLVESRVIRYPSFDGLKIPALLYRPKGASADHPAPALVWVHGGPGGQSRTGYSANIQYLVNHGYAVLAVNNRGSSGYGKTFFHMDDRRHGEVDLKDCVHARTHLESLDWVDGNRIGILGGSYGGYMVAAALAFEPEAFDVGIDIFGVTNWLRTLQSIPPWWTSFRDSLYSELGDPEKEAERLKRISPLFHASNIKRPLLVIQGANDPRVLKVESDELVEAVRANGVPVEYIVFDDEGHGFANKENRIEAAEAYRDFLDRYLRAGARR